MSKQLFEAAQDENNFNYYVLYKLLDLGFRVYGGAPRNQILRKVNKEEDKKNMGDKYYSNMWDSNFHKESIYRRRGIIVDIDCIGTYEQFNIFNSLEMKKMGDLKYLITTKKIPYPIPNINIIKGELETFNIIVTPKFKTNNRCYRTSIDIFVCKSNKLENLYQTINQIIDFRCNGLCFQKDNGILSCSLLYHSSIEKQIDIINDIKCNNAILANKYSVNKDIYYRTAKMMSYGWNVEFDQLHFNNIDTFTNDCRIFVLSRYAGSIYCTLCNSSTILTCHYLKISTMTYHLNCYIDKSIECYQILNNEEFMKSIDPVINDTDSVQESIGIDVSITTEDIDLEDIILDPDDDIELLNRFTHFARNQPQVLDDVIPEQNQDIQIVNNVAFFDGIAQPLDNNELINLRNTLSLRNINNNNVQEIIDYYYLCSELHSKSSLENLYNFMKYLESSVYIILRP